MTFLMASSFDSSADLKNAIDTNNFYDKSILFSSVDQVFVLFFSFAVMKKIAALLFADIFGWAYMPIIYRGFMLYVYGVANAVLLYLTAEVFISILFVLGPIFSLLLIFHQTKRMFDQWLGCVRSLSPSSIFILLSSLVLLFITSS